MSLLSEPIKGIREELKHLPWTSMSLITLWFAFWAAAAFGYAWVMPAVGESKAAAATVAVNMTQQVEALDAKLAGLANRVESMDESVSGLRTEQLETRIFSTRQMWCDATTANSKEFFAAQMQGLLRRYRSLTGQPYPMPSCAEIR